MMRLFAGFPARLAQAQLSLQMRRVFERAQSLGLVAQKDETEDRGQPAYGRACEGAHAAAAVKEGKAGKKGSFLKHTSLDTQFKFTWKIASAGLITGWRVSLVAIQCLISLALAVILHMHFVDMLHTPMMKS
jgi:hypothetical protein